MEAKFGQSVVPLLLLHGGAGPQDPRDGRLREATDALREIARRVLAEGAADGDPLGAVEAGLRGMEAHELFNAGRGAALQADGQARLTASVMDGENQRFSGVMGATYLCHPSRLARHLQTERSRVLASPGVELLARRLGLPVASPQIPARIQRWVDGQDERESCDTVGCVVRTATGRLGAGTSTGGRGGEYPGRISDSATVAGNYASRVAAISCTGVGEEIVDDAVAARLETRCRDGLSLEEACRRGLEEAVARNRQYGWIAADASGAWAVCHSTPAMVYLVWDWEGRELASSG